MKKTISLLIMIFLLLGVSSCYSSKFSATLLVTTNTSKHASASYYSMSGKLVFNLKSNAGNKLVYSGSVEEGRVKVYYDNDGTLKDLFELNEWQSFEGSLDELSDGKLYIIIETDGKTTNGNFEFTLE